MIFSRLVRVETFFRRAILIAEEGSAFEDASLHDFAGAELHDGAWWALHLVLRFLGIAADTWLGEADIENTEIAEFDIAACGESFDDSVERVLDHAEDLLLG